MGIKRYIIEKRNKIVDKFKIRREKTFLKKEAKKSTVNLKLASIQNDIARYQSEADLYHSRILELKHNYLEHENEMQTIDRKGILKVLKAGDNPGIYHKESVHPEARRDAISHKSTNPTLAQLNAKEYTKNNLPQARALEQHFNEDKKVKQLNIEIRPIVERARRVNAKIAKLEVVQSVLIAKSQLAEMEYKKIEKAHMSLIDSLFSKYKGNKINELGLRDLLQRINVEIERMKMNDNTEKDISENFNRFRRGIQEAKGKTQAEYMQNVIRMIRA